MLFHYDEDQPGKSYFFIPAGASLSHRPFGRAGAHQQSVPPAPPPSEDLKGHSVSYHCPPYNRLDWPRSRLSRPGKSQPSKVSKVCSSATSSVPVETAGVKFDEFVGGNNNIEHRKDLGVPIVETEKETGLPEPILMPRTPRISQLPLPDDEGQPTDIGTVPGATSDYVPEWGASTPPGPSNAPPRRLPPGIPISGMRSYATIEPAPQNLSLDRRRSRKSSQTEHRGVAQHRQPICQRPKTYVDLVARERIPKPRPKRESSARESSAPKNVKLMTTNHLKWRLLILRRLNELYQRQQYDMAYDLSQYLSAWDDAWSSHTGSGNSLRDCAVEDDDLKEMSVDNSLAAGGRAQLESSGVLELKETNRKRQMTSAFGEPLPEKYQKNATDRVIWDPKVLAQLRQTFVHNGTNSDPTRAPRSRLGMELGLRSWDNHQSRSELSGMSELTNLVVTSADEKKEVDEQDRENADEVEKKHGNGTEGESANERTTKGT